MDKIIRNTDSDVIEAQSVSTLAKSCVTYTNKKADPIPGGPAIVLPCRTKKVYKGNKK